MGIIFGYTESMFLAAIMTVERAITTSDEEGGALLPEQALSENHREHQVLPAALLPSRWLTRSTESTKCWCGTIGDHALRSTEGIRSGGGICSLSPLWRSDLVRRVRTIRSISPFWRSDMVWRVSLFCIARMQKPPCPQDMLIRGATSVVCTAYLARWKEQSQLDSDRQIGITYNMFAVTACGTGERGGRGGWRQQTSKCAVAFCYHCLRG